MPRFGFLPIPGTATTLIRSVGAAQGRGKTNTSMNKLILGATLALGLVIGAASPTLAGPGDGLDKNAAAQGNSTSGGMRSGARMGSRMAMPRRHMMHRHHRRHMMRHR